MVVAAADAAAAALGLHPAMPLAHAVTVVPGLAVADADPEADLRALSDLAAWCLHLSPLTAPDPPDGIWIDATGCAHLWGGEAAMLGSLARRLAQAGLQVRAAVADTPGAAHAVARHGSSILSVIDPGGQGEALAPLPPRALRIPAEQAATLRRLGITGIGALAAAPRGPLARRFGAGLLLRLDQATGHAPEPVQPVLPPSVIQTRRAFLEPVSTAESFAAVIVVLVDEACLMLERRGAGARTLDLLFERVDSTVHAIRAGTGRPSRDPRHLARLLHERIERVDPGHGVEAMRLVLPLVEPLAATQRRAGLDGMGAAGMGGPGADRDAEADLAALVDQLSNRLGQGRVYRVAPVESDVPERAVAAAPPLGLAGPLGWVTPWPRPARLLRRPEPVDAMGLLPDHPPGAFTWRRVRHRVVRADGPERITGEWWRRAAERSAVRDYWAVEDQDGRRFWLFRQGDGMDPATGGLAWFLHGFF